MTTINSENYFDYVQALYWFCSLEHEGQNCPLYSILSQLHYQPSLTEDESVVEEYIWDSFQEGLLDPEEIWDCLQEFL